MAFIAFLVVFACTASEGDTTPEEAAESDRQAAVCLAIALPVGGVAAASAWALDRAVKRRPRGF